MNSFYWTLSLTYCLLKKDFMVQGGDPTGTGKGGTSIYGQKLYVRHTHHWQSSATSYNTTDTKITPSIRFIPLVAKTRSIQNYGSQVPEFSQWPTQDQTPTVRSFPLSLLPPIPTLAFASHSLLHHCTRALILTTSRAFFLFLRLAILYDAGSDSILGQ